MIKLILVFLLSSTVMFSPLGYSACTQDHVGPCNDTIISAGSSNGDQVISLVLVSTVVYMLVRKFRSKTKLSVNQNGADLASPGIGDNVIKF